MQDTKAENQTQVVQSTFSPTVFTDGNRREISKFKKHYCKIQKIREKSKDDGSSTPRFKPTAEKGLDNEQVCSRVHAGLTNYVKRGSTKTIGRILFTNVCTWFNIVCFVALGLLIWVERYTSCYFIVITLINTTIGIVQELKAKYTIEKLSLISAIKTKVIRGGEQKNILLDDVVLDDIVVLATGNQIPADSVIVDGMIEVNESLLTGESVPIQKKKGDTIYAGSFVVSGSACVRVDKISGESYVQTLARGASRYVRPRSELLGSLRMLIRAISVIMILLLAGYIARQFGAGIDDRNDTIAKAVGAVVGMIPSGMFLLTSLALAVGVINLAKSRTLVQELYCIEMLARVDTLCLDKTGTITNGTMKVCDLVELRGSSDYTMREIISSMLFALDDNNQTSIALQDHFGSKMILKATKILPFSSSRKLSAVSFEGEGTYILGAPEFIFKVQDKKVEERVNRFASQGYRVLVLAKSAGQLKDGGVLPIDPKPVAIITLQDTIRPDAPQTIEWFKQNGVSIRVISGDNPITVSEVARRAGVDGADKYVSLDGMSPIEVRSVANQYTVFGRVSPEQKLILVKEFKNAGRTVAMTGDGVNDILALREADCSVAMAAGSEAARNVSHLVLLDNNFASMPRVVAQGRRVINNIQRTSSIFLFKTMFVMLIVLFCIASPTAQAYPFEPVNMFLIECFVIGIPSFALALEINDAKIKGKFLLNVLRNAFAGAIVVLLNVMVLYFFKTSDWLFHIGENEFTTMLIFATTVTGLFMLWKMIVPATLYRLCLMIIMTILIVVVSVYGNNILGIGSVQFDNILLLIIILLLSYPMIAFFNSLLLKIRLDRVPLLNKIGEKMDR